MAPKNKTPPYKNYPAWTEARFRQFIRSALRSGWSKYPPKYEALKLASRPVEGKRWKTEYQCACCKEWFKNSMVQVDHISPVGSMIDDWNTVIERMFVSVEDLQVLCKPCHLEKTNAERKRKK